MDRQTSRCFPTATRVHRPRVPFLLAAALLVAAAALSGCAPGEAQADSGTPAAGAAREAIVVTTVPAATRSFEERIAVQGNLAARTSAGIGPKIPGVLVEIPVDEGDRVVAGETVLFRVDDAKLRKAVAASRAGLDVAKAGVRRAVVGREQVGVELDKAARDREKFDALFRSKTVTEDTRDGIETRFLATKLAARQADAAAALAREQEEQAAVGLAVAEQDLADTAVVAPISGVVTARLQEVGELAAPGREIVRIVDTGVIEVSALLPASHYARVREDATTLNVSVEGADLGSHPVSYRSPAIDPKTRTFEVRALLDNPDGTIAPGQMAEIAVTLDRRTALGVPDEAVARRAGGAVVFVCDGDRAREVAIGTGLETDGFVEVTDGALKAGDAVVTLGQTMLEDGAACRPGGVATAGTAAAATH